MKNQLVLKELSTAEIKERILIKLKKVEKTLPVA